jgi:hypothetical protein
MVLFDYDLPIQQSFRHDLVQVMAVCRQQARFAAESV